MPSASRIKFGDYLNVTDEGGGVIRVDGCPPGGGGGGIQFDTYPQAGGTLDTETSGNTSLTTVGDGADLLITTNAPMTHGTILLQTQQKGDIHLDVEDGFLHLESEGPDGAKLAATDAAGIVAIEAGDGITMGADWIYAESTSEHGDGAGIRLKAADSSILWLGAGGQELLLYGEASGNQISLRALDTGATVNIEADGDVGIGSSSGGVSVQAPEGGEWFIGSATSLLVKTSVSGSPVNLFRIDGDGSVHIKTGTSIVADL